ncbi:unnamed protein product [Orchesella dallaii]|uniref:Uncharacterized protein n=1 Tax=Orchesella dallaii TaxID=48710 RepID=A0ABP1RIM5_9HEXA
MNLLAKFVVVKIVLFFISLIQQKAYGVPVSVSKNSVRADNALDKEYAALKQFIISDLGYTEEFADLVEVNLKRAIKEEKERQVAAGIVPEETTDIIDLRQQEEDYEDDTTPAGPTTPGVLPVDIVRGLASIIRSVQQLNVSQFWGSFVNFFPPGQRQNAQALIDASLGIRPTSWPTIPTTTTKLTTTTKDEDEIDSEESTTKASAAAVTSASVVATTGATAVATATVASAAATVTRAPAITRYMVRIRTPLPDTNNMENAVTLFQDLLGPSTSST